MNKYLYFFIITLLLTAPIYAYYNTPGTGIKWNLDDLVANSGGSVTFSGGEYFVNDTVRVSLNDTLYIDNNAVVKFAPSTFLSVRGTLMINPPDNVTFTAVSSVEGFLGMRIDTSSTTVLRKLTFEYAVSLRLNDSSPVIDSCIIRYNNNSTSTSFGNGAIALFRAHPLITNCLFLENNRAAIQGGANIANAPQIIGNTFQGNDVTNANVPQINLGASGTDTVKILNNIIVGGPDNSGGIAFLPIGTVNTVITGNLIINNRYGIALNGGSSINALISYNQIDSNNIQGNPMLGGSGIAFSGGSSTSHQNSIVTGNLIRWNLWGVTIQNGSAPNLGNLFNADTTDDGKNVFLGNDNTSTPLIDLYNNSPDTIYAQNNFWGSEDSAFVEDRIFHYPDNNALGPVIYMPYVVPVELISFRADVLGNAVRLEWNTATELNNRGFELQRNDQKIAFIPGSGTTSEIKNYSYQDENLQAGNYNYKLVQLDYDGTRSVVKEIEVEVESLPLTYSLNQNYPNPFNPATVINYSVPMQEHVSLKIYNVLGSQAAELVNDVKEEGNHKVEIDADKIGLSSGVYFYILKAGNFVQTRKMVVLK